MGGGHITGWGGGGDEVNHFDEEEMQRFGFDPDVPTDRRLWQRCEPVNSDVDRSADYSEDVHAFGSSGATVGSSESVPELGVPGHLGRLEGVVDSVIEPSRETKKPSFIPNTQSPDGH